jgi:hypothetical protein
MAAVSSIWRAMAAASRSFQKLVRVTLLPTVLMAVPMGAGLASVGPPCTSMTRDGFTIRSSLMICARPENETWPISDEPMVSLMLSSLPMVSQALTATSVAAWAVPGSTKPRVRPPAVAPTAPSVPRN